MFRKPFNSPAAEDDVDTLSHESTSPPDEDVALLLPPVEEPTPNVEDDEDKYAVKDVTDEVAVAAISSEDLTAVRDLILALHPSIVPELIGGESLQAIIGSIEPAQQAHSRIVASVRIPAGGNPTITIDADSMTTFDKIRRGLSGGNPRR